MISIYKTLFLTLRLTKFPRLINCHFNISIFIDWCTDIISGIAILMLCFCVTTAIVFGMYYYCENTKQDVPVCTSKVGVAVKSYIDKQVLPAFEMLLDKARDTLQTLKK